MTPIRNARRWLPIRNQNAKPSKVFVARLTMYPQSETTSSGSLFCSVLSIEPNTTSSFKRGINSPIEFFFAYGSDCLMPLVLVQDKKRSIWLNNCLKSTDFVLKLQEKPFSKQLGQANDLPRQSRRNHRCSETFSPMRQKR